MSAARYVLVGVVTVALMLGAAGSAWGVVAATEHVNAFSASTSTSKSVTVSCPAGKRVLSPGAFVDLGDINQVLLDELRPSADLTSATVNALEDETGTAANWTLSASAICATPPPGLQRVAATSPTNSANKSVTVTCPAGKRLLGAGADINSPNGQVILDDLRPAAALTAVTVNGVEDETGNSSNWSLTAYAVCANPIGGLERITQTSPLDSTDDKFLSPVCPGAKVLTGLGGDINSSSGQVLLSVLDKGGTGEYVALWATEDETGHPGSWSATAYGICAPGSRREYVTSVADSGPKNVNVTCATEGHQVTSLGGVALNGFQQVVLERFRPNPANNALVTAFEDDGGFTGSWQLSGNAVCTTPLAGQQIVAAVTPQNFAATKNVVASCPAGKRVVGAAGEIYNGLGQVFLDDVRPSADLTTVTANAVADETGAPGSWSLTARAICANPPRGLVRASSTGPLDSLTTKATTAVCPAGRNALSGAFELNTPNGQVFLRSLSPDTLLTGVTASGYEDFTGNPSSWSVTAYAICALP